MYYIVYMFFIYYIRRAYGIPLLAVRHSSPEILVYLTNNFIWTGLNKKSGREESSLPPAIYLLLINLTSGSSGFGWPYPNRF